MSTFTVRVELHGAAEWEYDTLHDAMRTKGFTRYITLTSGKKLQLPSAEYNSSGSSVAEVLESAKQAAVKSGRPFEVLVTESAGRDWYNLSDL